LPIAGVNHLAGHVHFVQADYTDLRLIGDESAHVTVLQWALYSFSHGLEILLHTIRITASSAVLPLALLGCRPHAPQAIDPSAVFIFIFPWQPVW
jgi:hypothetical protein